MTIKSLKIGTRGSKMALIQAKMVEEQLCALNPELETEIVVIKTSGDWNPSQGEVALSAVEGGKGLFAKELEIALLDGSIDIAVHAAKDMASFLPDGLILNHFLEREDPRDAFVSIKHEKLSLMPAGSVIGTSSVRREAFIKLKRPDLKVVPFRGNVPTRIEKLMNGKVDATLLSYAGLKRIGYEEHASYVFAPQEIIPACGQGVIGIEMREDRKDLYTLLEQINHHETRLCISAERAALQLLDGSCNTPIGAYATYEDGELRLTLLVAKQDGSNFWKMEKAISCDTADVAKSLGTSLADMVKPMVDKDVL